MIRRALPPQHHAWNPDAKVALAGAEVVECRGAQPEMLSETTAQSSYDHGASGIMVPWRYEGD